MLSKEENELITRTGPGTPMGELWRRFWLPALLTEELPHPDCPPVRLRLLSEDMVAFRDTNGQVALIAANCPHRGASLFFGRNEECGLRCVYHGWKFDVTGQCVDMPSEPVESNFKSKIKATAYPCEERGGVIWTYMGPSHLRSELPELAWTLLPETHRYTLKFEADCNYLQALEGDVDDSHFLFLHGRIDPDTSKPYLERLRASGVQVPGQGVKAYYTQDLQPHGVTRETDYGLVMGWRRESTPATYSWHINHWFMPYAMVMGGPPPSSLLSTLRVPIDDESSWQYRIRWNPYQPLSDAELRSYQHDGTFFPGLIPGTFRCVENLNNDYLIDREAQRTWSSSGIKSQTQQDRAVTETVGKIYDRTTEHLAAGDAVVILLRRQLLRAARDLAAGREPAAAQQGGLFRAIPVDLELPRDLPFEEGAEEWTTGRRAVALMQS